MHPHKARVRGTPCTACTVSIRLNNRCINNPAFAGMEEGSRLCEDLSCGEGGRNYTGSRWDGKASMNIRDCHHFSCVFLLVILLIEASSYPNGCRSFQHPRQGQNRPSGITTKTILPVIYKVAIKPPFFAPVSTENQRKTPKNRRKTQIFEHRHFAVRNCTKLCETVRSCAKLYETVRNCTESVRGVRNCTSCTIRTVRHGIGLPFPQGGLKALQSKTAGVPAGRFTN